MRHFLKPLVYAPLRGLNLIRHCEAIHGASRVNVFERREIRFGAGRPIGAETFVPVSSTVPALGFWKIQNGRILGDRGVLTTVGRHNYYHFLVDILPKLELILRSGTPVDHYVAPVNEDFQKDAYRLLGIEDKVIPATANSNITCDHLLVVDKLSQNHIYVTPHYKWEQVNFQLDWVVHFLNEKLLKQSTSKVDLRWTKAVPKRFCISRQRVKNRCILNEDAFVGLLNQFGVKQIILEDYSLEEKMNLFNNADLIVGQQGAGLTNIVFCRPGTVVLEIVTDVLPSQYFQMFGELKGLDYFYLASESVFNNHPIRPAYDCLVNLDLLEGFLSRVNSNPLPISRPTSPLL
jgi:capsular polysaccharide biosynthesis protein